MTDLELLHGGVQEVREQASLAPLPQLRSSGSWPEPHRMASQFGGRDGGVASPRGEIESPTMTTLMEQGIADIPLPIEQTAAPAIPPSFSSDQARSSRPSLRSNDSDGYSPFSGAAGSRDGRDFIAAGQISTADAQRLFQLYVERLSYFIYDIGGQWPSLESLRSHSAVLTASIMAVAALHDPQSSHLYPICNKELQRLIAASVFDRRVNTDYLRALCIASYWLSDMSWTLLGIAIRRATEINLSGIYQRVLTEANEDATDWLRLWYHLYSCDRHLSLLYSRQSLAREDVCIMGWEVLLRTPGPGTDQDKMLLMQLPLHLILTRVDELFGTDNRTPVPVVYSSQITHYSHQLDNWLAVWSTALRGK